MKKRENNYNRGYISFNLNDLYESATNNNPNADAYAWLYEATMTSSNIQKKNKKGKMVDVDDIYPVTSEETEQMRAYLERAERAVNDPNDGYFKNCLNELYGVINWSSKRHWTFQWVLIAGVIVTLFCLSTCSSEKDKNIARMDGYKAEVAAWIPQDTTVAFESMRDISSLKRLDFKSANVYKYNMLANAKFGYKNSVKREAEGRSMADTATTDQNKRIAQGKIEQGVDGQANYLKEYAEINKMKYEEIKEIAQTQSEKMLNSNLRDSRKLRRWYIFFMILIPLYVFSQRPYGYGITRMRLESKIIGGLQNILFGLAGGMAGFASVMKFMPDSIVRWSDGSTTRESDTGTNAGIMAVMLFVYAFALAIFCGTSCFIMTYLTFQGLRRNYEWSPLIAKIKNATASRKVEQESEQKEEE